MDFCNLSWKGSADSTTSMLSHHTRGSMKTCHKVLLIIYLVVVSLVAIAALILAGFAIHWQQADAHTHVPGVFTSADGESIRKSPENAHIRMSQLSDKLDDLDSKVQGAKQELSSLKKWYVSNHNALNTTLSYHRTEVNESFMAVEEMVYQSFDKVYQDMNNQHKALETQLQDVKQDFEDNIANVSQSLASEFQLVVGNFTEKLHSLEEIMKHSRAAVNASLADLSRDFETRLSQASHADELTHQNMADARETAMEGLEEKMNGQFRELYNKITRVENQERITRSRASSVSKAYQTLGCMLIFVLLTIFMT